MVMDDVSGSSGDDSLTGKRSLEEASIDADPIKKRARSWVKQWKVIKTAAGEMKVLVWASGILLLCLAVSEFVLRYGFIRSAIHRWSTSIMSRMS